MVSVMKKVSPIFVGIGLLMMLGLALNIPHIKARSHTKAFGMLPTYRDHSCDGKWVYYNITRGTIMVACGLENTHPKKCLFIPFRVTENMGSRILTRDEGYNCTVFVDYCYKGKQYDGKNGYQPWGQIPIDLRAAITGVFGEP